MCIYVHFFMNPKNPCPRLILDLAIALLAAVDLGAIYQLGSNLSICSLSACWQLVGIPQPFRKAISCIRQRL